MNKLITDKLKEIEQRENIRILHAVESGSRAWGFPSPDSDYDVRFIYVRPMNDYLKLKPERDVIELPINDMLDINGWDLIKTLRLLRASNPTLFEWLSSPIVYRTTGFADEIKPLLPEYFHSCRGLHHYLSMAETNHRGFLKGEEVKAKKYFYVLRPILACRWILERQTPPPMLFTELADSQLDPALRPEVDKLLDLKMNSPEIKLIPRVDLLNDYIESSIAEIKNILSDYPNPPQAGWEELDSFFLRWLNLSC